MSPIAGQPIFPLPTRARTAGLSILLAGGMALASPRAARADEHLSYKFQDYQESGGRIEVQVHSALLEKDLGSALHFKLHGVVDTIAGATPTGQTPATPDGPVPLARISEERRAWNADFSRQFSRTNAAIGVAGSRESDYISKAWSLNTLTDFNQKNTTLLLGVASTQDDVQVFFQQPWESKRTLDLIAGVTQLLDPNTFVTFNLTFSRATGYLSDPYKLIEKTVEVLPGVFLERTFSENRPDSRTKWIALAALNRAFPNLRGAIDASYRLHHDDFGITSHTLNLEWFQQLGEKLILRPNVRLFAQSAADFYRLTLDGTPILPPTVPTGRAPFYSADYRLSELQTLTYGLKAVWTPNDRLQFDVAAERYDMRESDGITSASAYPRATIFTAGLRLDF